MRKTIWQNAAVRATALILLFAILAAVVLYQAGAYDIAFIDRPVETVGTPDESAAESGAASRPVSEWESEEPPESAGPAETRPPNVDEPSWEILAAIPSFAEAASRGLSVTTEPYGKTATLARLSLPGGVGGAFSLRQEQITKKTIFQQINGLFMIRDETETVDKPLIGFYFGCLVVDNGKTVDIYDPSGLLLVSDFTGTFPYATSVNGWPVVTVNDRYYEIVNKTAVRVDRLTGKEITVKPGLWNQPIDEQYVNFKALRFDYPAYYAENGNVGLYRYGVYTRNLTEVFLDDLEPEPDPPVTTPPNTEPPVTTPPDTEPPVTVPPDTAPVDTLPADTEPADTVPAEPEPPETVPDGTEPPVTAPETDAPVTEPGPETAETDPEETGEALLTGAASGDPAGAGEGEPEETDPAETTPVESVPTETTPVESVPTETTPTETKPTETAPIETTPVETTPIETTPIETTPVKPAVVLPEGVIEQDGRYYKVDVGFRYGYLDENNRVAIEPQFVTAQPFSADGYAAVTDSDGSLFFIDTKGREVVSLRSEVLIRPADMSFTKIRQFYFEPLNRDLSSVGSYYFDHGYVMMRYARVGTQSMRLYRNENRLVDTSGRIFSIPGNYLLENYSEGILLLEKDGRYGYMDTSGAWISPAVYQSAEPFLQGLAVARDESGRFGMIDSEGRTVLPFVFDYITNASRGYLAAYSESRGWELFAVMAR